MHRFFFIVALAMGPIASMPAAASEALPGYGTGQVENLPIQLAMSPAKQRRLMIIEETLRQQERARRHDFGRGRSYDRGHGRGYGHHHRHRSEYDYNPRPYGHGHSYGHDYGY